MARVGRARDRLADATDLIRVLGRLRAGAGGSREWAGLTRLNTGTDSAA